MTTRTAIFSTLEQARNYVRANNLLGFSSLYYNRIPAGVEVTITDDPRLAPQLIDVNQNELLILLAKDVGVNLR